MATKEAAQIGVLCTILLYSCIILVLVCIQYKYCRSPDRNQQQQQQRQQQQQHINRRRSRIPSNIVFMMPIVPQNIENLSLRLSEVLSEIGVNQEMIMKRRTGALFRESTFVNDMLRDHSSKLKIGYFFGSQSEGSTTFGINSDTDILRCLESHHVISDWSEWKQGVTNVLMVQDERTTPGYCFLQLLGDDAPLAVNNVPDGEYYLDAKGRVVLKNTVFDYDIRAFPGVERHGPATNRPPGVSIQEYDYVLALRYTEWPRDAIRWLNRKSHSGWPSERLKSECERSGCFLVPVGSKISGLDELEWRISTSLAERYLMFSFNVTQMRCYVLMKMLLKSFPVFKDVISSYMCKTILFHCIENADRAYWQEHNLLRCITYTLHILYNCIRLINCPHFIIPENNLMAGRISPEQQHSALAVIQQIINSNGQVFLDINIDDIGERLRIKFNGIPAQPKDIRSSVDIQKTICCELCYRCAQTINRQHCASMEQNNNNFNIPDVVQHYKSFYLNCKQNIQTLSCVQQKAYGHIAPLLCSTIGTLHASYFKKMNQPLTDDVLTWLKLGLNSDVSSGLLKFATVCYSFGNFKTTEEILRRVNQQFNRKSVMPACGCMVDIKITQSQAFKDAAEQTQVTDFRHINSYCVRFMRCEFYIVPEEMRQEYLRSSTLEDNLNRGILDDWMDLAVIDSLPYLYFLQYKTYGRLANCTEQLVALHKLQEVIRNEPNLFHKETALNLLGQCMEQENLLDEAYHCYERSLQVRPRNNAASYHMSKLIDR